MEQLDGILHTLHNIEFLLRSLNDKHEKELVLLKEIATQAKPKKMLNHKEAAAFLGIHPSRLQVIMAEERIPVYRIGTKKLYKHSDLEAWLETRASKKINP
jgi:excisionase family DNA binding protein